jgi:methylmalonyl-CoA/ethylmalonyl-CoA epimerase
MIKGISHIGIAVKDLEESKILFAKIFAIDTFHEEIVEEQNVAVASFNVGDVKLELTAPTNEQSPIHKFIEKKGEGIHHIAFDTNEIEADLKRLSENGVNLINEKPTLGAHEMLIAFLHPKSTNGVLMELCQSKGEIINA